MDAVQLAQRFAHDAHDAIGQKRKYTGEPYWVHLDAVAAILVAAGETEDNVLMAAYLHDYVEDVEPKRAIITNPDQYGLETEGRTIPWRFNLYSMTALFPYEVCELVIELTDVFTHEAFPKMNRAARKEAERKRLQIVSNKAKTIKLADLINNTESIVGHDPDFARVYLVEKLNLLPMLIGGNPYLLNRASIQTVTACQKLGIHIPVLGA